MNIVFNNDIPKYLKKKGSDVSKSKSKSRHKHEYVDCLFTVKEYVLKGRYCKVCGKIRDIIFFETENVGNNLSRLISGKELLDKHADLEKIALDDFTQKYVLVKEE